jgi:hypothetical protein
MSPELNPGCTACAFPESSGWMSLVLDEAVFFMTDVGTI